MIKRVSESVILASVAPVAPRVNPLRMDMVRRAQIDHLVPSKVRNLGCKRIGRCSI